MKCTIQNYYRIGYMIVITLIIGNGVVCTPAQFGFSVGTPFKASFFDGKAISGHTVIIAPLLRAHGVDSSGMLSGASQLKKVSELRTDLHCVSFAGSAEKIRAQFGDTLLQAFLKNLYIGDIPVVQTSDSLWKLIDGDYMMVTRMKIAHTIRTFSKDVRKRILLEGELWDCLKSEVVFRISVNGICLTEKIKDDQFIMDGILTIFRELPAPSPSYDNQAW